MSKLYIASWSDREDGGIYTYDMLENGEPCQTGFVPFHHAGYLAWNSKKDMLYATGSIDDKCDCVGAFRLEADGSFKQLNRSATEGLSCCHLCVSPDDSFVYAVNYRTGNFAEFKVLPDGSLSEAVQIIAHSGKGPNPARQEGPHTHFCSFDSDGKYLLVVDLGIDAVMAYPYTPGQGISADGVVRNDITPGAGPRHLVFDKSGKIVYLINELGNTLMSFNYADGKLQLIAEIATLPRGVKCFSKASAIRLTSDEKFIAVTNRGYDTIAVFRLDGKGNMEWADLEFSNGSSPRDVNYICGSRFFAAGNEFSDNVRFFDCDGNSGKLTPNGFELELPRPLCFIE